MRFVRGLGGVLLWIVASLLGVVGAVLCVTVILLPVGIPLLLIARRMFGIATKLLLPREMSHPVEETAKTLRKKKKKVAKNMPDAPDGKAMRGAGKSAEKSARKRAHEAGKTLRKGPRRLRRRLSG
jgi:hypothetical protein